MRDNSGVKIRRAVARVIVFAVLAALGFLMYKTGREFDVMIDNGTVAIDGVTYGAMDYGTLVIDGNERGAFDMWADDRVIKKMVGANHTLTIKIINEDDDSLIKTVEREITLDFNTMAEMLSVSAIIAGSASIRTPNPVYAEPVFAPDRPAQTPANLAGDGSPGDVMMEP